MKYYTLICILVAVAATSCRPKVSLSEPTIHVGIMTTDSLTIVERDSTGHAITMYSLSPADVTDSLIIATCEPYHSLEVENVTIGVGFHWQQREPQQFEGRLRILNRDNRLVVINDIPLEKYLESVISSEMSADAPTEYLRAHAIVSRSWLLSQLNRQHHAESRTVRPGEITVWYDRDDHDLFDVCADDHCQRYQGITRRTKGTVAQAVRDTRGMALMYGDTVCDARFSKCCGGVTEEFEACWEPVHHPYLESVKDADDKGNIYCANVNPELLAQVLNGYDRATTDYYRWKVEYNADSLGRLFARRSGFDLGYIRALEPLERGKSGRIVRLRVVGEHDTLIVGKELEIRRTLSPSHLYSSAFTVEIEGEGPDAVITLEGIGWGHGVGMCQIGAAAMVASGRTAPEVLSHYYPGSEIKKIYQ